MGEFKPRMYWKTIQVAQLGMQTKVQVKERITFQMHCLYISAGISTGCIGNRCAIFKIRIMDSQASILLTVYVLREKKNTYLLNLGSQKTLQSSRGERYKTRTHTHWKIYKDNIKMKAIFSQISSILPISFSSNS